MTGILRLVLPRLLSVALMMFLVSMMVFAVLRLLPIDADGSALAPGATEEERQVVMKAFGLDRPVDEREVLMKHALRNAALPTLSLIGVQAGFMFGGTLLVEVIFGWPGLGNLMVTAARGGDMPMIQAALIRS